MLGVLIGALPASLGASIGVSVITGVVAGVITFRVLTRLGPRVDARFTGLSHRRVWHLTVGVSVLVSLMSVFNGVWFTPVLMGMFILQISTLGGTEKTEYEQRLRQWRVSSPARWGLLSGAALILAGAMIAPEDAAGWFFLFLWGLGYGIWTAASSRTGRNQPPALAGE